MTTGAARQVLATLVAEGGDPAEIVEREGLAQMSDAGELEAIVERAIEAEPAAAEKVRAGNPKAIGPIVGAVMRETKGTADGGEVTRLIREKLGLTSRVVASDPDAREFRHGRSVPDHRALVRDRDRRSSGAPRAARSSSG